MAKSRGMTKKHYEAIAKAINSQRNADMGRVTGTYVRMRLDALAEDLAFRFQEDNPQFDSTRFLRQCGTHT